MMDFTSGTPWETVTLTALSRDRQLFLRLLSEARDIATRGQQGKVVIHTAWGAEWKPFGAPRRKRDVESVVLEEGVSERIENDVRNFLDRSKWYAQRGWPESLVYYLESFSEPMFKESRIGEGTSCTVLRGAENRPSFKRWRENYRTTFAF